MSQERVTALNVALAQGRVSRMSYLLARMRLAEEEADQIIKNTPQAQPARLLLQADDQSAYRPKDIRRSHHPHD